MTETTFNNNMTIDINDYKNPPAAIELYNNPYSINHLTIKDIVDNWELIYNESSDTIIHALSNIIHMGINSDRTFKASRMYVTKYSLQVLTSPSFNPELANNEHARIIALLTGTEKMWNKNLMGKDLEKNVTNNIELLKIRNKVGKGSHKGILQSLASVTGVFLPTRSIPTAVRSDYFRRIQKKIKKIDTSTTITDYNSACVIHQFLKDHIPPTTFNNEEWDNIPQFFLNRKIDVSIRRKLFFQDKYNEDLFAHTNHPEFGSQNWCASKNSCKNDLHPRKTQVCSVCLNEVHTQCCNHLNGTTCFECEHPAIIFWNDLSGGKTIIKNSDTDTARDLDTTTENDNNLTQTSNDIISDGSEQLMDDTKTDNMEDSLNIHTNTESIMDRSITVFEIDKSFDTTVQDLKQVLVECQVPTPNLSPVSTYNTTRLEPMGNCTGNTQMAQETNSSIVHDVNMDSEPVPINRKSNVRFDNNLDIHSIDKDFSFTRMQIRIPLVISRFDTQWSIEQKLGQTLTKLMEIDANIAILPWEEKLKEKEDPITPSQIASLTNNELLKFFPRLIFKPKQKDNYIWLDFYMQHQEKWNTIKDCISSRLNKDGYSIYPKAIQDEREVTIGWLLWSFREIDTDVLSNFINKKYNLQISFRWTTINSGQNSNNKEVKALHVVSAFKSQITAKKEFNMIYHVTKTTFPLGMRMRFVPILSKAGPNIIERVKRCRLDQKGWLSCLDNRYTTDITMLDTSLHQCPSLRELLMKLKSKKDNRKLFMGINKQWNSMDRYIFTFRKEVKEEAINRINTLYLYLKSTTGYPYLHKYFSDSAIETSQEQVWDSTLKEVIQSSDLNFQLEAIDKDIEHMGIQDFISYVDEDKNEDSHAMNVYLGKESSSVTTFASNKDDDLKSIGTNETEKTVLNDTKIVTSTDNDTNNKKDINQLFRSVAVIDANVKQGFNNNEEIIGRLISLEALVKNNSITTNTESTEGPSSLTLGKNK
jgi:hypothetical protein